MKYEGSQRLDRIRHRHRFIASALICTAFMLAVTVACRAQEKEGERFRIFEDARYGYIDSSGNVVVRPVYRSAGEFSEGLAPVRTGGLYGYIDRSGQYVVGPRFDYAAEFREGYAVAWRNGKPVVIDHEGRAPFAMPYASVESFHNGRARVMTTIGHVGVIDLRGRLVVDTVHFRVGEFSDGRSVVQSCGTELRDGKVTAGQFYGVVDTTGRMIVPYGIYNSIDPYSDGMAQFRMYGQEIAARYGYLDTAGRVAITQSFPSYSAGGARDGMVVVAVDSASVRYKKIVRRDGPPLLDTPVYQDIQLAGHGLAFASRSTGEYRLIRVTGELVGAESFDRIDRTGFRDGLAVVGRWGRGLLDTLGRFVVEPRFVQIVSDPLPDGTFLAQWGDRDSLYNVPWGIIDTRGNIVLDARFQFIDHGGFRAGLLGVVEEGRFGYVDRSSEYVWREEQRTDEPDAEDFDTLDVDVMNRGHFYAYSSGIGGRDGRGHSGGWYESPNVPDRSDATAIVPSDTFAVVARPDLSADYEGRYAGFTVFVVNATRDSIVFDAQDSRLNMKIQALDMDGMWRDIEYLPNSWCGNSYHTLTLKPGEYWKFVAPFFHGEISTRFRVALESRDLVQPERKDADDPMEYRRPIVRTTYSNEWAGSVNPGQFWRRPEYSPAGLMDPYNE